MGKFDAYKIPLKSLEIGTHEFDYKLDTAWFELIDGQEVRKGDVRAKLKVRYNGKVYEVHFSLSGNIEIPCDRCLDEMSLPIEEQSDLFVKFGESYAEESDNVIVVPETEGELNVAWFLYEMIVLSIPLKHVHAPGKCNKEMTSKLKRHLTRHKNDEDDGTMTDESDFFADMDEGNQEINPIWEKLKELKDSETDND